MLAYLSVAPTEKMGTHSDVSIFFVGFYGEGGRAQLGVGALRGAAQSPRRAFVPSLPDVGPVILSFSFLSKHSPYILFILRYNLFISYGMVPACCRKLLSFCVLGLFSCFSKPTGKIYLTNFLDSRYLSFSQHVK